MWRREWLVTDNPYTRFKPCNANGLTHWKDTNVHEMPCIYLNLFQLKYNKMINDITKVQYDKYAVKTKDVDYI